MSENTNWVWFLTGRVLVHVLIGALFTGLCGALLLATSGAFVGWILDMISAPTVPIGESSLSRTGAAIGAILGIRSAVVGATAFGLIGFFSPPLRSYFPASLILKRVAIGMSLAILGAMTSFFVLIEIAAIVRQITFQTALGDGLLLILVGAPLVMMCGLIFGAVSGFRHLKKLAKQAEAQI